MKTNNILQAYVSRYIQPHRGYVKVHCNSLDAAMRFLNTHQTARGTEIYFTDLTSDEDRRMQNLIGHYDPVKVLSVIHCIMMSDTDD